MKKIIVFASFFLIFSCTSQNKIDDKPISPNKNETIKTGWLDNDTYTVQVVAEDEEKAKAKARHKILKDIVNVRMMNQSKYTDITKIQDEFDKPLKNGKIIQKKKVSEGIFIFFQIKDKGLKLKFEKK